MNEDYDKVRPLAEFLRWLDDYMTAIRTDPARGIASIKRNSKFSKRMFEEAWPIGILIKNYYQLTGEEVIQLFSGSQSYDAVIAQKDGKALEYIEVTQAIKPNDHENRRNLAQSGFSVSDFTSIDEDIAELAIEINRLIADKLIINYPQPAILIVGLHDDVVFDQSSVFNNVLSKIRFPQKQQTFRKILFTTQNGLLHKLWKCGPTR